MAHLGLYSQVTQQSTPLKAMGSKCLIAYNSSWTIEPSSYYKYYASLSLPSQENLWFSKIGPFHSLTVFKMLYWIEVFLQEVWFYFKAVESWLNYFQQFIRSKSVVTHHYCCLFCQSAEGIGWLSNNTGWKPGDSDPWSQRFGSAYILSVLRQLTLTRSLSNY